MTHLPNPIFDQAWPLLDVAMLTFCIALMVWMTCVVMDSRQCATRPRTGAAGQLGHPSGEFR